MIFNKIEQYCHLNKEQMASGQGRRWLVDCPMISYLCMIADIFVNFVLKHKIIHAASIYVVLY